MHTILKQGYHSYLCVLKDVQISEQVATNNSCHLCAVNMMDSDRWGKYFYLAPTKNYNKKL